MSATCRALGVSQSNLHVWANRSPDWRDARRHRSSAGDAELIDQIRAEIGNLPTYGHRRTCGLVNRTRRKHGASAVNAKRVYRVMAAHTLLLPKAPRRHDSGRVHDGVVGVAQSDKRWCSDGFQIACESGEVASPAPSPRAAVTAISSPGGRACRCGKC